MHLPLLVRARKCENAGTRFADNRLQRMRCVGYEFDLAIEMLLREGKACPVTRHEVKVVMSRNCPCSGLEESRVREMNALGKLYDMAVAAALEHFETEPVSSGPEIAEIAASVQKDRAFGTM